MNNGKLQEFLRSFHYEGATGFLLDENGALIKIRVGVARFASLRSSIFAQSNWETF